MSFVDPTGEIGLLDLVPVGKGGYLVYKIVSDRGDANEFVQDAKSAQ
ncbi:MAG: hypothetical protein JWQ01_295 [Massilia sp.]|nr:hypothetical protein [Massilia sp.]